MFIYLNITNNCVYLVHAKGNGPQLVIETIKHKITIVCVLDVNGISRLYIHNLKKLATKY